jgi:glycosyltransferase involved in cell wall biosynthesis
VRADDERRLLRTVESALTTLGDDGEVVLVLDGPRPWLDVPSQVRVVEKTNGGCASAMNVGVRAATYDAIARLDMGDVWHPRAKRAQLADFLERGLAAQFAHSISERTGEVTRPSPKWWAAVYRDGQWSSSTTVFTREAFELVGGYDESLPHCDDWDFDVRVQHHVGWTEFAEVTGTATTWPGGVSDATDDVEKQVRIRACRRNVLQRARALRGGR